MLKHHYKYLLFLFLALAGCKDTEIIPQQSLTQEQEHLLLGNPSGATTDESNANNYLSSKPNMRSPTAATGARPTG